jgi:ribosomal protein S18 acetylase RimI-like enzyme
LQSQSVFISAKVPTTSITARRFLEQHGFHLVDTNVTFWKDFGAQPRRSAHAGIEFRWAEPADCDAVVEIARCSFQYSRFHLDPAFPHELANEIKAAWAANYFNGERGDEMVVAVERGKIIGFAQLLVSAMTYLTIDLIAVDPRFQRRGAAAGMIDFAEIVSIERWPYLLRMIMVGTQLANTPSIALYEKLGFRLMTSQYVFHFHNPPEYVTK